MIYLAILLITACNTTLPDNTKLYKKNLGISLNNEQRVGIYVAEKQEKYTLKLRFSKPVKRLKINTCHRYVVKQNIGKSFTYSYKKVKGIEDVGVCVMDIGAFDETGHNAWAMIEFKNDSDVSLPAILSCNGSVTTEYGVSICQSQVGLRQSIQFKNETNVYGQDECGLPFTYDKKTYFYDIDLGNCVYIFQQGKEFHRHRTFGYNDEMES